MVIRYVPVGVNDELSCCALIDVASTTSDTVVVGALMTTSGFGEALSRLGYVRDEQGYPFRYSLLTPAGVRIVDVLGDADQESSEPAFPVFGLAKATRSVVDVTIELVGLGKASVRLPTLDGAFLLRCLALADGAAGLKFEDYARDAAAIGQLLLDDPSALALWRARSGETVRRAREIALPLFASSTGPGPLVVGQRAIGDRVLAARQAAVTFSDLFTRTGSRGSTG